MDSDYFNVINRIKKIKGLHTDVSVAQKLGISKENLAGYKSKGTIPYEHIINLCARDNLSADLILFGREEIVNHNENSNRVTDEQSKRIDRLEKDIENLCNDFREERKALWDRYNKLQDKVEKMDERMKRAAEEKDVELLGTVGGSAN